MLDWFHRAGMEDVTARIFADDVCAPLSDEIWSALIAFGGADPMHAPFLADGIGIRDIITPPGSGVFFLPYVLYWQTSRFEFL